MPEKAIIFIPTDLELARELYKRDYHFSAAVDAIAHVEEERVVDILSDGGPRTIDAALLGYIRGDSITGQNTCDECDDPVDEGVGICPECKDGALLWRRGGGDG